VGIEGVAGNTGFYIKNRGTCHICLDLAGEGWE